MAASKWLEAGFVMATFPMVDYSRSGKDVWNYAECASQVFMAAAMSLMAADSFLQTGGTAQTGFALLANLSILSVPVMVYMDHLWHRNEPNHRACPHEAAHQKKQAEKKDQAEEDGLLEGDGHEGGEQGDEGVGGGNAVLSDFDVDCQDGMAKEETPAVSRNPLAGWWGGSGNEDETAPLSPSTGGIAIELHAFTDSDEDGLQDDDMINIGTSMEVSLVDMALTHKEHAKVLEKVKKTRQCRTSSVRRSSASWTSRTRSDTSPFRRRTSTERGRWSGKRWHGASSSAMRRRGDSPKRHRPRWPARCAACSTRG